MAEEEGFEPPEPCGSTVFKTAALNHSATPPSGKTQRDQSGGQGGIRTPGRLLTYGDLANRWFQPLTHLSAGSRRARSLAGSSGPGEVDRLEPPAVGAQRLGHDD